MVVYIHYENFTVKTVDPKKIFRKNKVLGNWPIFMLYIIVRLPLQPTTPHWETPSMAVRAIFLPVCHRRTAQGLPNWIQTMFGRAVFYSTISIDDINAQSGWSLKTEKIRLKWHVCSDTIHTLRHLFLTWTSLYPSLHFSNLTQSYAALPLAFL